LNVNSKEEYPLSMKKQEFWAQDCDSKTRFFIEKGYVLK